MIQWGAPGVLPWLWLLVPLAAVLALLALRRERRLRLLLDDAAAARLAPGRRRARAWAKAALWFVAFALVAAGLARPRWGIRWQESRGRGLDIVVVLDASDSMRATDVAPDRLQRAKWAVSELLRRLSGDRVGLVAFAGSSFLACPLTADLAAFSMMLDDVRPGVIPRGGTALAPALETALRSFESTGDADRAIVLISDGEDHEGAIEKAVAALAAARVRVFAVGVGTIEGGTIPAADGAPGGLLRDRSGAVVRTALREDALQRIAVATGGIYVRSTADDSGMERVFGLGIAKLRRGEKEAKLVKVYEERFPWFLGAAVLLLACEALLADAGRRKEGADR